MQLAMQEQILNFLNAKLFLPEELVLDTKFECLMNLGWLFAKNVNHSLPLESILEFVWVGHQSSRSEYLATCVGTHTAK